MKNEYFGWIIFVYFLNIRKKKNNKTLRKQLSEKNLQNLRKN